jgi:hypothetical protein
MANATMTTMQIAKLAMSTTLSLTTPKSGIFSVDENGSWVVPPPMKNW